MSLVIPCSGCEQREPGKLMQVTWAWYRADGERVAWRQRLCETCAAASVFELHATTLGNPTLCPVCHSSWKDDMDPVYATFYPPGVGKVQGEYPTCGACAVDVRVRAQKNATRMEDRPLPSEGQVPGPQTSWQDTLRALGIVPRE